jgi:hypothetical protein
MKKSACIKCGVKFENIENELCYECHKKWQKFWAEIEQEKFDLTEVGHWSGTGLVNLSEEEIIIV